MHGHLEPKNCQAVPMNGAFVSEIIAFYMK
jgi:hypothetical protein